MEKPSYGIRIAAVFLFAATAAAGLTGCSAGSFGDALFEQQLIAASNEQNKKLPQMIDEVTRWDSTVAGPGKTWTYLYTLVDPNAQNITNEQINDGVGGKIRTTVCTLKDMELFVKKEVTVKYKYQDSSGRLLGEVIVTPGDCKKMNSPVNRPN